MGEKVLGVSAVNTLIWRQHPYLVSTPRARVSTSTPERLFYRPTLCTKHTLLSSFSSSVIEKTENNPGRRFLGCSFYGRPDACDYFKWVDPLVQPRYKSIINGLLRNANHKDALVKKLQRTLIYHRIVLATVVMVVFVYCVL
ncbi:Uncharacterized protein Fot_15923 [Forsythia ovata]|uniref:GRF-type domain-containing protein n=1 Tax=Forsythia ovata TaxID=205694 RepID=A0ABD1WAJ5_9LAMI